jgi:hypothetical protein
MMATRRVLPVFLAGALLAWSGVSRGGPAASSGSEEATKPSSDEPAEATAVPELRRRLETDLAEIGLLLEEAGEQDDAAAVACVEDVQDRAQDVMEVVTDDVLVVQDPGSSPAARTFAVEKLQASSDRMKALVEQARLCVGDEGGIGEDPTDTDLEKAKLVPLEDPTRGPFWPIPPPIDDTVPPVVASPAV